MGAAKLLNEVPALAEKIQDGTMNLAKIAEISRAVKEKEIVTREMVSAAQKVELVAMISGKTTSESQQDLARALDIKIKEYEKQRIQQDGPRMRRLVSQRDKCCQHKDHATGLKCGSRFALQVDHKISLWAGGSNSIENLQALCASHNQYKYRKESQRRFV